jgi:hypothetical protein
MEAGKIVKRCMAECVASTVVLLRVASRSPFGAAWPGKMLCMTQDAKTLVLWDVDHTLIENSGVSKENYALAFEFLTGRAPAPHSSKSSDVR